MRSIGLLIIALAFAIPLIWFTGLAQRHDTVALVSQYFGVCALIAMGLSQIMATRFTGLEAIFGGMDRIYVLHKWLGIGAMALVLLHDTIDAEMNGLGRETGLTELAETLGEISLYGLLILVVISVTTFVPYHLWKYTHKLMGGFFAASAFHFAFIQKPFGNTDPLGLYVLAFCIVGIIAYVYTLLPIGLIKGWRRYTASSVMHNGDAITVTLAPDGRGHRHRAGQFAFLRFEAPAAREIHPFTISMAPDDDRSLRFSIKPLGDYTGALGDTLDEGVRATVSRPFGHFHLRRAPGAQIWIASGVGITPFVAWAQALDATGSDIHLFYTYRDRESAPHLAELTDLATRKPNLHLHLVETSTAGRLTPERVVKDAAVDLASATVAFCGPKDMRETFRRSLVASGLPARRFRYEEFEIRSGIGLRRLAASIAANMRR